MAFGAGLPQGNNYDQGSNERRGNGFTLTQEQLLAKKIIQGSLAQAASHPKLAIMLVGLSGTGKSTLFSHLAQDFSDTQAVVHPMNASLYRTETRPLLVSQGTPNELERFQRSIPQDYHIVLHTMRGMNTEEMTQYANHLLQRVTTRLSTQQLIHFSMGIPTLLLELAHMYIPDTLREQDAKKLAEIKVSRYLHDNIPPAGKTTLGQTLPQYVAITPPTEIYDYFALKRNQQVYDGVDVILLEKQMLQEQGHNVPINPFFVAPESEGMYNRLYAERNGDDPRIDIYIPGLNAPTYQKVVEAFGLDVEKTGDYSIDLTRAFGKGTASRIFEIFYITRKAHARMMTPTGEAKVLAIPEVNDDFPEEHFNEAQRYQSFSLPIALPNGPASIYFNKHDHSGFSTQTAYFGFMAETVLQQLGVFYIADNGLLREKYCYDPQSNHILKIPA